VRTRDPLDQIPLLAACLVVIGVALNIWPEHQRTIGALTVGFAFGWLIYELAWIFRNRP
jgi:EamA domain-containing membrane protein RarD